MQHGLITEGFERALSDLKQNTTPHGLLAASPHTLEAKKKNYTSLFSRDIGVSSLGILLSEDEQLIKTLKVSLENLVLAQSDRGQFPFYYKPEVQKVQWFNPGSIDSTLWWCIAFLHYKKHVNDTAFYEKYLPNLEKAFAWLSYQDTNNDTLLEQGEASDWADEMPRIGTVLYTNTLWYWLVKLRCEVENKEELEKLRDEIHDAFNSLFWIHKQTSSNMEYIPKNSYTEKNVFAPALLEYINSKVVFLPYYLGYVSHKTYEMRCEVYGNLLACITGLADKEKAAQITDFLFRSATNLPYPVKALYPPIYPGEPDWRDYMAKGRQNYPWQYHNGGIWPYIGGFWVMWLAKQHPERAEEELHNLSRANSVSNWEFNEYLHGEYGTPMGVAKQSWNMSMYIAAYKTLFS